MEDKMNIKRKYRRLIVVAPMRSHCQTVRTIFENGSIPTYLREKFSAELDDLAKLDKTFGIVAGTGVGKTVFIRDICKFQFGDNFKFDVVTKEEEATDYTWTCDVIIVTTGIAMNYLKAGYIDSSDVIIIDEIHQTSDHLELTMALARHLNIKVNWMSATIDPVVYKEYFKTETVLFCENKDPGKRAQVSTYKFHSGRGWATPGAVTTKKEWIEYYLDDLGNLRRIKNEGHGVVVFLPTRASCEKYAKQYAQDGLSSDFYHGGESATKLLAYLRGQISKPFIVFMTAAGSSSLNVRGLDWVIIQDEMYGEVVNEYTGVKALQKMSLGPNELLQMAGRVDGRVKDGTVAILTEREIDYTSLSPINPNFVLAGDLEQVALTCARMRIDLNELDPIGKIDHQLYQNVWFKLVDRKLITRDNELTEYGQDVVRYPVPRIWGEYLAKSPDELLAYIITCAACPSLYSMLSRDGKYKIDEFKVEGNDFLTKYNLVQYVIENFAYVWKDTGDGSEEFRLHKEFFNWAKERGVYAKTIKEILISIVAILRPLGIRPHSIINDAPLVNEELVKKFNRFLLEVDALELISENMELRGKNYKFASPAKNSLCQASRNSAYYGTLFTFRNHRGQEIINFEGVVFNFDDLEPHLDKEQRRFAGLNLSGDAMSVEVAYQYPGFGFHHLITHSEQRDAIPDDFATPYNVRELEEKLIKMLAQPQLYPDLEIPADVAEHNERVINEHCADYYIGETSLTARIGSTETKYRNILEFKGAYTLKLVHEKGMSLKFPEVGWNSKPMRTTVTAEQFRSTLTQHVARFGEDATRNLFIPPKETPRKLREATTKSAMKPAPSDPKCRTQDRVNWLMAEAEKLRSELQLISDGLETLKGKADKLGESYDAAFKSFDNKLKKMDRLTDWQDACKKVTDAEKFLASRRADLRPKIDAFENEAIDIMTELEK
jgi:hypoxanthine phosphoribosyltransferase